MYMYTFFSNMFNNENRFLTMRNKNSGVTACKCGVFFLNPKARGITTSEYPILDVHFTFRTIYTMYLYNIFHETKL